ncbi:glycosyl hydrolase [Parabacteroides distasonis]|uniref:glycosyl hydrolase n=1 Tax=Parabacteroides distasonis TaxID=823 RepID=UPI001E35CB4D|nr:glycosyl hydrolase [Parabacteroides distasonis]MDB8996528.1 glycosyl hydrolase [Parabacteroides distasonis]MDB9072588.1 glycosyl hydrolase [Parabacteroides distasonis]
MVYLLLLSASPIFSQKSDELRHSFNAPPNQAKPRVYWWWLYNRINKEGITRDLQEFKEKGISGVNLICTGGYAGDKALEGIKWLSPEWRELFRHAVSEAKRLDIELGFNLSGGWTMLGPWVTYDNAMKKVVQSDTIIAGGKKVSMKLAQPETVEGYYKDVWVQAFRIDTTKKLVDAESAKDLTLYMKPDGNFEWKAPKGNWLILRTGYTLTGHTWSRWFAYPQGDTFAEGAGYEIDYLSKAALDNHFNHLGTIILDEVKKAGGDLAYFWSDSWECGKLTWTQDFPEQFMHYRKYDLKPYMAILSGYIVKDSLFCERFQEDFDRTIQDCIADNYYGHFYDLCHKNGLNVGNEAGGPNDIPPQDVLKNLGRCDIPAGEFWVHYKLPEDGMNSRKSARLNLKQTASAAHIYGLREAQAEAFTQMEQDRTHWSLGPYDLKPYANDAFCEGINRFMLHQSTCQPPEDGKPGYEFCAGQHFTPNLTWWEQSSAFFSYLSRCQYLLQEGKFVGDVCYYIGEQTPSLVPPQYIIPSLGLGYDCDYTNVEVLLTRMSVKDGRIVLPDGMSYRLLYLQNCVSPDKEICEAVSRYQQLEVPTEASEIMSLDVLKKLRELIMDGATVIGAPPTMSAGLDNYPYADNEVRKLASEIWGDLDGKNITERRLGKGRIIWGKTAREVLQADGIGQDFAYLNQTAEPEKFNYIHRSLDDCDIYFVINRTGKQTSSQFTFRVQGKQPEIWDPVTGEMRIASSFTQHDGYTTVPLEFVPYGSYFVVFDKTISTDKQGEGDRNFSKLEIAQDLSHSWEVMFDTTMGGPQKVFFEDLSNWIDRPEEGIKYYSGTATYRKSFDLSFKKGNGERIYLDLGDVKHISSVRFNNKDLGVLWCTPWRIDITDYVKETGNFVEIDVINLWANRVIGDWKLPKEQRFTRTHDVFRFDMLRASTPLTDAGLLGPVSILKEKVWDVDTRSTALDLSPAKWIWYPAGRTLQNTFVLFRKDIVLDKKPHKAIGWILADSRYRLFVNGKRIQWGPAPSDPRWQEADPIDLTAFLTEGKNVIAVEVCFFGSGDGTHPMGKPGFILNLDMDQEKLVTDASWDCFLAKSWRPGQYKRWFLRSLQEEFDARLYPYGWDTSDFKPDENWTKAILVSQDGKEPSVCNSSSEYVWEIFGDKQLSEIRKRSIPTMREFDFHATTLEESMWIHWKRPAEDYFDLLVSDAFETIDKPITRSLGDGEWEISPQGNYAAALTFSFPEQGVGWPHFTIDAPEGTIVELLVHEAHQKGGPALINSHFNSWSRFICKEGINHFETFDFESFRWLQLHIRNFNRPIKIASVGMRRRIYPWKSEPTIVISDDTIQHVVNAAVNTLFNCAQETLVDGMARERQQYSGDGSHQLHAVIQTLGDITLPYRFVNTFSQGLSIDGYFMDSWPAWDRLARTVERQMHLTGWGPILDHSIGFCFDAFHYYMYTGDLQGLKEVYPRLLSFFSYLYKLTDKSEHLVPAENLGMCSVYIDHEAYKQTKHKQLALNLYIVAMCRNALSTLCQAFGDTQKADEINQYAADILQGCIQKFWDKEQQVYVNNLPWKDEEGEIRYCDRSLATALIFDLCPNGETAKALNLLEQSPAEMGVSYPCNAVWPLWALVKYRKINTVLSDLREKWGNMSSVWANNTLQEFWQAYPDEGSQWSHCAMYPLIALNQGIAGVYPLKPGCERIKMEPQLGDLEHIRFDVQTLKGAIQFSAQGIKGKRELRLQVPDSLSIELRLDKREKVDLPLLRTEKDGINVYKITHPGSYVLKLKYT